MIMVDSDLIKARNLRLCFSPNWRMRNDDKRVVLYKYNTEEVEWRVVPPLSALALSLFDGMKSLKGVAIELANLVNLPLEKAQDCFAELIGIYHVGDDPILVRSETVPNGDWCTYDPVEMIIPTAEFQCQKRLSAPLSLLLMPFNTCQVNCRYCYSERRPIERSELLTIERWRELINEAADAGVDMVSFSGGDPMLYPDIISLLEILIERDFSFLVSTKAFVSIDTAMKLADIGMGKRLFQISLDAWTPEVADNIVQSPDYRDCAVQSIKNLIHHGIRVRTNTVCTPYNYQESPQLVRNLIELGVVKSSVTIYGRSIYRHHESLFVAEEDILWLQTEIKRVNKEFPEADVSFNGSLLDHNKVSLKEKQASWRSRARCSGGISSMTICADGRVILCEQMPQDDAYTAGNLKRQDLLEVWNSPRMMEVAFPPKYKFKDSVCFDCDEFDECHYEFGYCFRDALNAYGTVFMPPPNCPKSPPSPRFA